MKVGVVIAAGGSSSRMGFNKLLAELNGVPVIVRTVLAFDGIEQVEQIAVVTSDEKIKAVLANYPFKHGITFADSGANRFLSAKNGFEALSGCDFVAVHDGARPFATPETITAVAEAAKEYGGAIAAVPVTDTIKCVKDGFIASTPDRSALYGAQTPQGFRIELYRKMLAQGGDFTDDSQLAEAMGIRVKIVTGSYDNIKITTPEDIARAEIIAKKEDI